MNQLAIRATTALFLIALCCSGETKSYPLSVLRQQASQDIYGSKNYIAVNRVDTNKMMYATTVFLNLNTPFEPAVKALLDFDRWTSIFDMVTLMEKIVDPVNPKDTMPIYYTEARYGIVKGLGMGKLDKKEYIEGKSLYLQVRPVRNQLIKPYLRAKRGKGAWYVCYLNFDAYLIKVDDRTCRIRIFAWAKTNMTIPQWLASMVVKLAIPKMANDLKRHVNAGK